MSTTTAGLNGRAWMSLGIFVALTALVVVTSGKDKKVGIRELAYTAPTASNTQSVTIGGESNVVVTVDKTAPKVAAKDKADVVYAAEQSHVDSLMQALAKASAGSFITARAAKHKDLGVDDEAGIAVEIATSSGVQAWVFGKSAKDSKGLYVRQKGSDEVFVLQGMQPHHLKRNLDSWRKHKVFDKTTSDVKTVEVKLQSSGGRDPSWSAQNQNAGQEGQPMQLVLDPQLALPAGFHVDTEALGRVVTALLNVRAAGFDDDKKGDTSANTFTLTFADGSKQVVHIGAPNAEGLLPCAVDGDPQHYLLPKHTSRTLLKGWPDMRDLHLFRGRDIAQLKRAVFNGKTTKVVVEKQSGVWLLQEPTALPGGDFDPNAVDGKLRSLLRIRATKVADGDRAAVVGGPSVELTFDGEEQPVVVAFGTAAADAKEVPVTSSQDELVYATGSWLRDRYDTPETLFVKTAPPPGMGGGGMGGMQGLDQLPPEIRKQLEQQLKGMNMGR